MTGIRHLQNLSRRQRRLTPLPFAAYLVAHIRAMYGVDPAVLWTCRNTLYSQLLPSDRLWGEERNALLYTGPWPIIAHPPCGPWGKLRRHSKESKVHGIRAMELVHRFGGVVEHPLGSSLFREHGRVGRTVRISQCEFGHLAAKPTLLYFG